MTRPPNGVAPEQLEDNTVRRELEHLHETRHQTVLDGSEPALEVHTARMLQLEQELGIRSAAP